MKTETGQSASAIKKRWNLFEINGDSAEGELIEPRLEALRIDPEFVTNIVLCLHRDSTFSLHVQSRHPATMDDYEWREFEESIGEDPYDIRKYIEQRTALPSDVTTVSISPEQAKKLILAACCYSCPEWFDAAGNLTIPR